MTMALVSVALGCGLKTTALPAAIMLIELWMSVPVGLVIGVSAPMTPTGANSRSINPWSPVTACGEMSSVPGVLVAHRMFSRTLSS